MPPVARHRRISIPTCQEGEEAPRDGSDERGGLQGLHPERLAFRGHRVGQEPVDEEGLHGEGDHARREHDLAQIPRRPKQGEGGEAEAGGNGEEGRLVHHALAPTRYSRSQSSRTISAQIFPEWSRRPRKSTRLNSSHVRISYAVFCLKKKK